MEMIKKSNYLIAVVFASLLLSAMAGEHSRKLLSKDEAGSMEISGSMQQQVMEEDDQEVVVAVIHKRVLRQAKMDDYGRYDPTPTMSKPHFKDIPN